MVSNAELTAPVYSSGEQAAFFSGGNATSVASRANLKIRGDYTIAAWVYPTRRTSDWARVIGKGSPTNRNYGLWIHPRGWVLSQSYCLQHGHNIYDSKKIIPLNQWSLIVGVYKQNEYHKVYVDGELLGSVKPVGTACNDNEPLTIGKASFHTGFIGKIKKAQVYNYAMTADQLDTLEEDVPLTHIVDWLARLITEASQEITTIRTSIDVKKRKVQTLQGDLSTKVAAEGVAKEALKEALRLKNEALGKKNGACGEKDQLVPGLNSEIKTFNIVNSKLRALLGKELVEDSTNVTAFISLEDQADPVKVNNVVSLVEDLIAKAKEQIVDLEKACQDAEAELKRIEAIHVRAEGQLSVAVQARETAELNLKNASGELEAEEQNGAKRIPQLESEIDSLKTAIDLIKSVQ